MTTDKVYRDDEGTFNRWYRTSTLCPKKCVPHNVDFRTWDSSDGAYTDTQLRCLNCKHIWWIDGDDG